MGVVVGLAGLLAEAVAGPDQAYTVLADRGDATVVRVGAVVAKAHPPRTDPAELAVRLEVAADPLLRGILLPPRRDAARAATVGGRVVSAWPYGVPVDPGEPCAAPWEEAGTLLARLHAVPADRLPDRLPAMRGPAKAAAAMARMADAGAGSGPAARSVRAAWGRLPAWARGEAPYTGRPVLCHGDWHLGQLVCNSGHGGWVLIDVDDLGLGDPAWDLARPAMWFGAGLLGPGEWARFLGAYRSAGGTAVPPDGDPWERLDVPARALAVQSAATALAKAARDGREPDEAECRLLAACDRIAQLE